MRRIEFKVLIYLSDGPWNFAFNVKFYPPDPSQLTEDITRWEEESTCLIVQFVDFFCSLNLIYLSVHSFFFVGPQVLSVSAAERWRGIGPSSLLLCHPHRPGLLHGSVWAGRLWPRGAGQRLHQRAALRPQPDQRTGGEGHGAPQDLQVSHSKTPFHRCNHCGFSVSTCPMNHSQFGLSAFLSKASICRCLSKWTVFNNKKALKLNVGEHFC